MASSTDRFRAQADDAAGRAPETSAAFVHLVFAVGRGTLRGKAAEVVERVLRETAAEGGAVVEAVGVMPDHVHLALFLPPGLDRHALVEELKAASAYVLNRPQDDLPVAGFAWRPRYGGLAFGAEPPVEVIAYVEDQAALHAAHDASALLEDADNPFPPPRRRSAR